MDAALKRKWVKALLSGEYKQGTGGLRQGDEHCCLGVLIASCGGKTSLYSGFLDNADLRRFHISEIEQSELAGLNDSGVPFDMIAGLIETAL